MARLICDTAPILAAVDVRDPAHAFAGALVAGFGRDMLVLDPVVAEVDYLIRSRIGLEPARLFLRSLARGEHTRIHLTPRLFERAVELDEKYADLDLGFVDASVMAYAEWRELPILTFDFGDFRATRPESGRHWTLIVQEADYRRAISP